MAQVSDVQGSLIKRFARLTNRDAKDASEPIQQSRTTNPVSLDITEARIEHRDWIVGDAYIIDVKERVTKELREINVNLTKEEESFLDYTPIPGAEYRVVDHLRKCEAKHKDTGKVSTTNDPAAQTRTKKIKLRIDTFLKKKSVISFVGGFFNFLEFLSGLMDATLDAVTSDYVIGFKVMMLVVKAFNARQERASSIKASLEKITKFTDQLRYLQDKVRGQTMRQAIEDFFFAFSLFAIRVYHYTTLNWKITQLAKAMAKTDQYLDGATNRVLDCWARVESVQSTAILATSLETRGLVAAQTHFQACKHTESILTDLAMEGHDPARALDFNDQDRRHLAPADRWVKHIRTSSVNLGPRTGGGVPTACLTWISAQLARRNVSWVSSFSVDLIAAIKIATTGNNVAHVFCKHGQGSGLRPSNIITSIIAQILIFWPELVLYHPEQLPRQRFQKLRRTGASDHKYWRGEALAAWELLRDMLRVLETSKARQGQRLLILIDRIDLCKSNVYNDAVHGDFNLVTDFSVLGDLIPRLAELTRGSLFANLLITAARIQGRAVKRQLTVAGHGTVEICLPQVMKP